MTNGNKGWSMTFVKQEVEKEKIQHAEKDSMEKAILAEIEPKFSLTESAPICQGWFRIEIGTLYSMEAGIKILQDKYFPVPGLDQATVVLLE